MNYIQAYYTDVGIKRRINQDSVAMLKAQTQFGEVLLVVLCDGMGGHNSGELASKYCVQRFSEWFKRDFPELLYTNMNEQTMRAVWTQLIHDINYRLAYYGERNKQELGSTLTAFLFCQDQYYVAQVGDSRGYEILPQASVQLTQEHSFIASQVENGTITVEQARKDSRRNYLTECMGITYHVNVSFCSGQIRKHASYLLCSDGFWHCLEDNELERYLSEKVIKNNSAARMHLNYLVEQVKMRGETDNISAIIVVPTEQCIE